MRQSYPFNIWYSVVSYIKHRLICTGFPSFLFFFLIYSCSSQLNAQVTYPALQGVVTPNPNPGAPGDQFSPPMSGTPVVNTPTCAEWTRTAGPDESAVITGINFSRLTGVNEGRDTRFLIYEKNGIGKNAKVQRIDGDKAVITIAQNISGWGMYLIWPGNEIGYGTPIPINQTEAWWVGPDRVVAGAITSVYGRNLAHNNDSLISYVYIKPASGAGTWATVTKVNPYKVDFIVPQLANGTYEVWVHNGHGGEYGWSKAPNLIVQSPTNWNATIINVKNYGATGDGTTDDAQAITNAINAAGSFSTIYFPAGNYLISNTIELRENMRYKGAGKNNTTIRCRPGFSGQYGMILIQEGTANVEISDIAFNPDGNYNGETATIHLRGVTDLKLRDINFNCNGYNVLDIHSGKRNFIDNCLLTGGDAAGVVLFLGTTSQTFIDSCVFKLTYDVQAGIASWGGVGVSMTYTTCEDFDNSDPNSSAGWGLGRFFTGNGIFGSNINTYLGNNTTKDLTVRLPSPDQNVGEHFMWEGNFTVWSGFPSSSANTTVNISGYTPSSDTRCISIVQGKGLGQSRKIVSYTGGVLSVDKPWKVNPDATSRMVIGSYADKVSIYNNYLDAKSYAATNPDHLASAGIVPFGGVLNLIADNNTLNELREGISNWTYRDPNDAGTEPNFFNLFARNKLQNCRWGVHIVDGNFNNQLFNYQGAGILGTIVRKNIIQNAVKAGIITNAYYYVFNGPSTYPVTDASVYEHNSLNNIPIGFQSNSTPQEIQNQIFYKNNFVRGTAPSPGYGIEITNNIALRENTYSGFIGNYNVSSGIVSEAPYHVIQIPGSFGTTIVDSVLTLHNSGTTTMVWTATSNATWLTLSPATGIIQNEGSVSNITLSANPAELPVGSHVGYVTITSGTNIKVYTVLFDVSNGGPPPPNQLPSANAGADRTITLPTNSLTQTGSGTDPDGTIASYQWTKILGPAQFTIVSPTQAVTVINNLVQGVYQFELRVTDNLGATDTDTVQVTVNPGPPPPNQPPTANAGADGTITLPTNSLTQTGSGTDPDGTIASYQWTKILGPAQFTIVSPTQAVTVINNLVQGVYQFELMVTDNLGAIDRDTMQVTVNPAPPPPNQPPTADAGADRTITLPTNSLTQTGSGTDPDGTIASYLWTKILGPAQFAIVSPTQAVTVINNLVQGVYQFELRVTDNLGATDTDTVQVTVNPGPPPPNQPPTADAGADRTITLPANSLTQTGSGTDPDGTIASYLWTKILGPAQFTIVSPTQAVTVINNLVQGVYQFELMVTDNLGAIDRDTMQVTVNLAPPPPNQPPTANAGADRTITLPTNSLTQTGSGTDPDGTIASYLWTKILGPTQFTIVSPTQAVTVINNLVQGVYQFELMVTDNLGAIDRDTVQVTVNPAPPPSNKPPIANAGTDFTIIYPINNGTLTGGGTDPDGTISAYQWTKISGPAQFTIVSPNQAQTVINNLVEGIYQFELRVTDNLGATGRDTVEVLVVEEPRRVSTASVYPNPATTVVNVVIKAATLTNVTNLRIYDSRGILFYEEQFLRSQRTMTKQIDVTKFPRGVYFIKLGVDINNNKTLKFIRL